ncbi:MAG: VOC family protein, partial [Microbacterium sp.]
MDRPLHHSLSYIELGVADLTAARAFYESAFGWEFNDYGPAYSGIRSREGSGEIGGLNAGSSPGGDGPLV